MTISKLASTTVWNHANLDHSTPFETASQSLDESSPAYLVVGRVSLGEVVHAPMEEADKNLPKEVAATLLPLVHELYGNSISLPASGIKALLSVFGLLEMPYHEWDEKIRRRYITRLGIEELQASMRAEPLKALKSFASTRAIRSYEEGLAAELAGVPLAEAVAVALQVAEPQPAPAV